MRFAHGYKHRQRDLEFGPPELVSLTKTCDPRDGTPVRTDACPPGSCPTATAISSVPPTPEP